MAKISRRQFLRGDFSGAAGAPPRSGKARIGSDCLARQDVVCRACGEACEARAIRFSPRPMAAALPHIVEDACNGCGACVAACPARAIDLA